MVFDSDDRSKIAKRTKSKNYPYRLSLGKPKSGKFSFLVIGDTGDKGDQYEVAKVLERHLSDSDFLLHLGDVIYPSGSKNGYPDRFIKPYAGLLKGSPRKHDEMVFRMPFFPILGNHDYYGSSSDGKVFEQAFIAEDGAVRKGRPLSYSTAKGKTRLPNRYYWFTYGKCAVFALDSNTLDALPDRRTADLGGADYRKDLQRRLTRGKNKCAKIGQQIEALRRDTPRDKADKKRQREKLEALDDQLIEAQKDVRSPEVALASHNRSNHDADQISWLRQQLRRPELDGHWKIVSLHHPLYSSETSHTNDPELKGMQSNLREVFVEGGVHLVLAGHSHCFEWARSKDASDRSIAYIVTGGGGRGLRRTVLENPRVSRKRERFLELAESLAYSAKGHMIFGDGGGDIKDVYHFLRIDVLANRLEIHPIGVGRRGGKSITFPAGMPVKSFHVRSPSEFELAHWLLDRINVYRDRAPQAPRLNTLRGSS